MFSLSLSFSLPLTLPLFLALSLSLSLSISHSLYLFISLLSFEYFSSSFFSSLPGPFCCQVLFPSALLPFLDTKCHEKWLCFLLPQCVHVSQDIRQFPHPGRCIQVACMHRVHTIQSTQCISILDPALQLPAGSVLATKCEVYNTYANADRYAYTGATTASACSLCQPGTFQTGSGLPPYQQ